MNARQTFNIETLESQAFALAARLHVFLRREKGRVTDIEYMRQNPAYCRHVIDLAGEDESPDVHALCSKLEELYLGPDGVFIRKSPPKAAPAHAQRQPVAQAAPAPENGVIAARVANEKKYIGRLR